MAAKSNSAVALAKELGITKEDVKNLKRAGWTPTQMRKASPNGLRLGVLKAAIPNRPAARVLHTLSTWADDEGTIDYEARYGAYIQAREMRRDAVAAHRRSGGLPVGPPAAAARAFAPEGTSAGLPRDNSGWISLGPHHVGGRARAIVIDPNDSNRIYAASVAGGIWLSLDGGESWEPTEDLMANMAIASMVMDPTNSNRLYAGTGEGFYIIPGAEGMLGTGLPGLGIFTTADGWSWSVLPSTQVSATNRDFEYVNGLAVSGDGQALLAATGSGIHRSADQGDTWTNVRPSSGTDTSGCVFFDPHDGDKVIAAGMNFAAFSTNGGASWMNATLPGSAGRIQLTYAQGDSSVVYACVNRGTNRTEIWRSTDGGASYSKRPATGANRVLGQQGDYANAIWAFAGSSRSTDIVLAGGLDLYRSTNGAQSFQRISDWSASQETHNSAHADHHVIVPHPHFGSTDPARTEHSKTVYFGNDGGVYRTRDYSTVALTSGWENINNGYSVTQFYRGAGNPRTKTIIGGAQDNGTQGHTAGNYRWDRTWVWLGDGTIAISDPTDPSQYYGAYPTGHLFRAVRTTTTVDYPDGDVQVEGTWTRTWPSPPGAGNLIWLTPFVLDPNNANVMFAGGSTNLYRSSFISSATSSFAARWQRLLSAPARITDIAVADTTERTGSFLSNRVVVSTRRGEVLLSDDASVADAQIDLANDVPSWSDITPPTGPNRTINRLFIDSQNPDTIFVCYGGFASGNLWKTTDAGGSWDNIGGALPNAPIYGVTVHPQDSDWVYVASEAGLFASENGGQTWSINNGGPANVSCADLFWLGRTLVCVTHARGMFQIDLGILGVPDHVLATDAGGVVYALNGGDGTEVNRLELGGADALTGATVISEGEEIRNSMGSAAADAVVDTSYVGDASGKVFCVDAKDVRLKWTEQLGVAVMAKPEVWLSPDDKTIYLLVSSADGSLTAFDLTDDHAQAWAMQLPDFTQGDTIWSNRVMDNWSYISSESGVFAVRLLGGRAIAWQDTTVTCTAPSMAAAGLAFVPTTTGVVAYRARLGDRLWAHPTGAAVRSQPVWSQGAVIFGTADGSLVGVDHRHGTQLFTAQKGDEIVSMAVGDDTLYFVANGNSPSLTSARVLPGVAGDAWTLSEQWSVPLAAGSVAPPVVVDDPSSGTRLYVTTQDQKVTCFDATDGSSLWMAALANASDASVAPVWPESGPGNPGG